MMQNFLSVFLVLKKFKIYYCFSIQLVLKPQLQALIVNTLNKSKSVQSIPVVLVCLLKTELDKYVLDWHSYLEGPECNLMYHFYK